MQLHNDIQEVLLTNTEIVSTCENIANRINNDYKDKNPLLICLLKGAVPYFAELIKHIKIDIELDFMKVSSYDGANSSGKLNIISDITTSVKDRDVIFVEDIVDTGITLSELLKLFKNRNAKSVEITTLLDKPARRVRDVYPKYVGKKIPDEFVVGFGLDYNEKYRALPYIGILKKKVYEKDN